MSGLEGFSFSKEVRLPNQKAAFGFISKAREEGDYIIIECYQYISRSTFPAFLYKDFIDTLNIAAEFNTRNLVFTQL